MIKKLAFLTTMLISVNAMAEPLYAEVVSSTPIMGTRVNYQQQCNVEPVLVERQNNDWIVGAVVGGVIGNAIGHGGGRAGSTAIGSVIGSRMGSSGNTYSYQNHQRCYSVPVQTSYIESYMTTYSFNGELRSYRSMAQYPVGSKISVEVIPRNPF